MSRPSSGPAEEVGIREQDVDRRPCRSIVACDRERGVGVGDHLLWLPSYEPLDPGLDVAEDAVGSASKAASK